MKKIIALCLIAILALSAVGTSFAEGAPNETLIEYTVYDTYEFEIPPQISINDNAPLTVSITNKTTVDNLNISLTSKNYLDSNHFILISNINPSYEIEYQLIYNDNIIANDVPFATFRGNGTANIYLNVTVPDSIIAGKYTDTITFHFG